MIVKIFTGPINYQINEHYVKDENEFLIGVDRGAYHALKSGVTLDIALGDFDSVSDDDFTYIKDKVKRVIQFPKNKNETDTYLAIKEALTLSPNEIIVYGGMGERLDHTIANIALLKQGNVTFVSDDTIMFMLNPGKYQITNKHKYISFFAIEKVRNLTLEGFKYPLMRYVLQEDDARCISNEGSGELSFVSGLLLVLMTKLQ